jgi:hypothetical protein
MCVAISVATRGSVFIRKWVARIRALIVPKGMLDRLTSLPHFSNIYSLAIEKGRVAAVERG